jgi:hypothetical protein
MKTVFKPFILCCVLLAYIISSKSQRSVLSFAMNSQGKGKEKVEGESEKSLSFFSDLPSYRMQPKIPSFQDIHMQMTCQNRRRRKQ